MNDHPFVTEGLHSTSVRVALALAFVIILLGISSPPALAADSAGTDFWIAFPANAPGLGTTQLTLLISSNTATSGVVSNASLGISTPFSVAAGSVASVPVANSAELLTSDTVESKGVHVTSLAPVTVHGLSSQSSSADGYLGLPVDAIGTSYIVMSYPGLATSGAQSEFAVVGTQSGTTVTITPSVSITGHAAHVSYTVLLDQGKTYQLVANDSTTLDLSGTIVTADKPISVFGASECSNVPAGVAFCDYLVEQLFPTTAWGTNFVAVPLATRTAGDVFRLIASQASTVVSINGATAATMSAGQVLEMSLSTASWIQSSKPLLVAQYSKGTDADAVTADPFMMLLPSTDEFLPAYTIAAPLSGFTNYVNLVAPSSAVGSIRLDGTPVAAASFTSVSSSGYSGATLSISSGSHSLDGPLPFGISVYGNAVGQSYGYPGGMLAGPLRRGDANADGSRDMADVFYLINHVFGGGPAPLSTCGGDPNSDGIVSALDVVFLINYFFGGGAAPAGC